MGFAQEIRDFLGASQSVIKTLSEQSHRAAQDKYHGALTEKVMKDVNNPLNDIEQQAKIDQMKASAAYSRGRLALDRHTANLTKTPINRPTVAGDVVVPDSESTEVVGGGAAASAAAPAEKPVEKPKFTWAKGGLVRKFADGGVAEEDDNLDLSVAPAIPTAAQPIGAATIGRAARQAAPVAATPPPAIGGGTGYGGTAGAQGATAENYEIGSRGRRPSAAAVEAATEVLPPPENAIAESAKYGVQVIGGGEAMNTTVGRMKLEQYMRGAGAAPVNEMHEIYKKIDPTGKKYSESERNLRAFNALYNFKLNSSGSEGPDAARKVGAAMLQHHRTAYERYKAIAAAALEGGNLDVATKAAMKSYANILDNKDLKLWVGEGDKIGYSYTGKDADGKDVTIKKGIMTPSELGAVISGQNAKTYDQWLLSAAGVAQQEIDGTKKPAVGKGKKASESGTEEQTTAEYIKMKERTDKHVNDWYAEQQQTKEGKAGLKLEPKELAATKNMLYHAAYNNNITEDEALRRINTYVRAPEPKEGERLPFQTVEDKETNSRIIQFPDGFSMRIPENEYRGTFRVARGEALAAAAKKAEAPVEKGYGDLAKETGSAALEGVKGTASRIVGDFPETAKREGFTPETYGAAAKIPLRAIQELHRPAMAIGERLLPANPGNIPVSDEDRPL